jgi:predicted transcriptional regulator
MFRFLKNRSANPSPIADLGHLEAAVMDVLWESGESSVQSVMRSLPRRLAYTTVMTTLDRLFKKGLLDRRKADRAFLYSPRLTRREWEVKRAGALLTSLLERDLLISGLVDGAGPHDEALLEELEKKILDKRRELRRRKKT